MSKTIKATTAAPVPAFPGRELLAAQAEHDRAAERVHVKYQDKVKALFNSWLDAARAAGVPRDEAGCKALRRAFVEHEVIARGVVEGVWLRSTIANYAQGAMRAFYHGAEWSARAFQSEDKGGLPALPWSTQPKGAASAPAKAKAADKGDKGDKAADKASEAATPNDAIEARAFIVQQLTMLDKYGQKNVKVLDLTTRDLLDQIRRIRDTMAKIGTAD